MRVPLLDDIRADLWHAAALWEVAPQRRAVIAAVKVVLYPRVRAVVWFRLAQRLWAVRPLRWSALIIQGHVLKISGAELHPAASVGPGLCLAHSAGVVIGADVVIGRDALIFQGVTLGHGGGPDLRQPIVGDGVVLGAGAAVLGGLRVGHRSTVGANAVVLDDVPEDSIAIGAPARSTPKTHLA